MPCTLTKADIIEAIQRENGYSRKPGVRYGTFLFATAVLLSEVIIRKKCALFFNGEAVFLLARP